MDLNEELKKIVTGDVDVTDETRDTLSHDASIFELKPQVVVFPKNTDDVKNVVKFVTENKPKDPSLSITPRSRGTDMGGGAIGQSILLDVSKYLTDLRDVTPESAHVQPGKLYREFDEETKKQGSILPSYPASRSLASVGGMVNNNSGGELNIRYGKTDQYVTELEVVLSDGNSYIVKPLTKPELDAKMAQGDFEGDLYRRTFELLDGNYDKVQAARPNVSKDSTGYHLWNIWNRETGIFDLTKLFIGAQGTLGIVTDIKFRLVPDPMKHVGTLAVYLRNTENLGNITEEIMSYKPLAVEVFDDQTLWLSFKFVFAFLTRMNFWAWAVMCLRLIPTGLALLRGVPKLILLIEFDGEDQEEVNQRIRDAAKNLRKRDNITYAEEANTYAKADKFWKMRQESFNLLRSKVKDKHTAPYIDDFVVPVEHLEEFLPKVEAVIKKYKLLGTIAGHLGDGNFHIIPLMKFDDPKEREKIRPSMEEVYKMVLDYKGSISGEHNDGMVRGPWLEHMYSAEVLGFMKEVKSLYDPQNIFNPHKKTDATWEFSFSHIRENF